MVDLRKFTDAYDLYRPTIVTSSTGEQTLSIPGTPTVSANPCMFMPKPGTIVPGAVGVGFDYEGRMLVPSNADIKPGAADETPDRVEVAGAMFSVKAVHDSSGRGLFKMVYLQSARGA